MIKCTHRTNDNKYARVTISKNGIVYKICKICGEYSAPSRIKNIEYNSQINNTIKDTLIRKDVK